MSITNSRVTALLDKYFEARPQLIKPAKSTLGYQVNEGINNFLNSMEAENKRLREACEKMLRIKPLWYPNTDRMTRREVEERKCELIALDDMSDELKKALYIE